MILNGWTARLLFGCAIWLADISHHNLVLNVSNTPEGMLVYHGTASLFDLALLICASSVLYGRLADDMQRLCWLSMAVNAAGWFLYLAYKPAEFYNSAIGILGYVQCLRLLWAGTHANHLGRYLVCRGDGVGSKNYLGKTYQ